MKIIVWMPLCTALILSALGVGKLDLAIGVLMIGSPTAMVSYVMAAQMKGDTELAGSIIMVSTLFSIATYVAALMMLPV